MKWLAIVLGLLWWSVAQAQPIQYPAMPNCQDSSGQHLNYNRSTFVFSCGITAGASSHASPCVMDWPSNQVLTNATYPCVIRPAEWLSATVTSIQYYTNGTSSPSFVLDVLINGTPVGTCNSITVSSSASSSLNCTAPFSLASGDQLAFKISSVSGNPLQGNVQAVITHTP